MVERIGRIELAMRGVERERFLSDWKLQDIVLRNLEVLGEAAGRVSEPTRRRYPKVPWRELKAIRNVLIHQYGAIDLEAVWASLRELSRIRSALRRPPPD